MTKKEQQTTEFMELVQKFSPDMQKAILCLLESLTLMQETARQSAAADGEAHTGL